MTSTLSPNTQAILLLTAPLLAGRDRKADVLSSAEYGRLARHLRDRNSDPAALLTSVRDEVLKDVVWLDPARVDRLLGRGFLLSQVLESWRSRALWVVSRADAEYPKRLKARLRENSPPILYGCGDPTILNAGGLAVVGSRRVSEEVVALTIEVGRIAASAGHAIISGGARGVDQAAMRGALESGGRAVGILADRLEAASLERSNRNHLRAHQLVLVSPYDPTAGFHIGHAMERNKLIYALADMALVANSDFGKGGTWTGAVEQLERLHLVPIFVRTDGPPCPGLDALREKGALPWPVPFDTAAFDELMASVTADRNHRTEPDQLSLITSDDGAGRIGEAAPELTESNEAEESGRLRGTGREVPKEAKEGGQSGQEQTGE